MAKDTTDPKEDESIDEVDSTQEDTSTEDSTTDDSTTEDSTTEDIDPEDSTTDTDKAPEEDKGEELDIEQFKKETVELASTQAQKQVMEKIAAGLGLTTEDKKEIEKDDELIPPWEQRGEDRPKSWKEQAEYAADLAEWKRNKQDEEIKRVQEDNEKEAKEQNKKWNDYWDTELDDLVKAGKLPEVKNEDDPNDKGKLARIKLFKKMQEIGLQRQKEGLTPITSVKLVYYEHYQDDEVPGADAPVSFSKKGVNSESSDEYSYHDIHGKTIDQIKEGK